VEEEAALDEIGGASAVETVAEDGVAEGGQMDADLMRAAGADFDFEISVAGVAFDDAPVGEGGAAGAEAAGHLRAMNGVAGDGLVEATVVGFGEALDDGEIDLVDFAGGELFAEGAVGGVGARDDDDAAGFFVEAMDDTGTIVAAGGGELAEVVEQGIDEGAGVLAGAGMDDYARGFVDDDDVFVFIEDVEGKVFGFGVEGRTGLGFDGDAFGAAEQQRRFGGSRVDEHAAGLDPLLEPGAAEFGQAGLEVVIEALAFFFGENMELHLSSIL
jgi:hypothetical protein